VITVEARAAEFACSPKRAPTFVRGSMASLWDEDGREYIDCGASFGVGNLGHCNPAIVEAIASQARELIHAGPALGTTAKETFVGKLLSVAPRNLERVFLSNSGSEAVEAAIKFARAATGRPKVVAAMRGFHGRTMGALSATWRKDFREPFEPLVPGFVHVPFNDVDALRHAVDGDTAAVLLEAVQGEGGVHVASPEYLPAAREICDQAGTLLILDEVQTGMGRTGRLFAIERWGVEPDLLTLAKSLAGACRLARPWRRRTSSARSRAATTRRSAAIRSPAPRERPRSTSRCGSGFGSARSDSGATRLRPSGPSTLRWSGRCAASGS